MNKHGFFSPIAEYDGFDYASGRSFWRRRSLPSLLCEWLGGQGHHGRRRVEQSADARLLRHVPSRAEWQSWRRIAGLSRRGGLI